MMPDDPNATEDRADNTIIPSEPIADAAQVSRDTDVATPEGAASGEPSPEETALSQEELAGLSDQLAERGIDLGSLLGTMMAGASQAKAKPKPRPSAADAKDDPATLMGKLAESLGLSPEALAKQLGPILKKMLAGQAAASGSKPRRKPKKDSAKPAQNRSRRASRRRRGPSPNRSRPNRRRIPPNLRPNPNRSRPVNRRRTPPNPRPSPNRSRPANRKKTVPSPLQNPSQRRRTDRT